ncbi:MAG: tRNA 5'-guanylyltransferase [Candidatus Riflebacteria bacterium]|nr:tRNA 5'-guanylyltransferase [Candidatus Riflebacteria bacterium]
MTLEARMRSLEYFHELRLLPGAWAVVRVDGRGFSRLTATGFEKPFDDRFAEYMRAVAVELLKDLQAIYAYQESDEVSVVVPPTWDLWDRELEKIVSISAAIAAATFTHATSRLAHFDSRLWMAPAVEDVIDYFRWRQADATRCALNGWCHWTLVKNGMSPGDATTKLHRKTFSHKNELLFQQGINFTNLPAWQRRGVGVYWESYQKEALDPHRNTAVTATRRRIKVNTELPIKGAYETFLRDLLLDPGKNGIRPCKTGSSVA